MIFYSVKLSFIFVMFQRPKGEVRVVGNVGVMYSEFFVAIGRDELG